MLESKKIDTAWSIKPGNEELKRHTRKHVKMVLVLYPKKPKFHRPEKSCVGKIIPPMTYEELKEA